MADLENVIKAIDTHINLASGCDDCTYENDGGCLFRLLNDARGLLEATRSAAEPLFLPDHKFGCQCGAVVKLGNPYCWSCGRKLKWD